MRKLLWKEWHEQSWKLGFGCLVPSALAWIGLRSRIIADETMVEWVCFIGFTLLPILSSTGLVPAERAEGSLESLLAMPINPWRILAAKTVMGMLLCAGPMGVAMVVSLLVAGGREISGDAMLSLYGRSMLSGLSLFIWMLALTVRLPNETRAGLLAVGVLILWAMFTGALWSVHVDGSTVPRPLFALSPLAFVYPNPSGGPVPEALSVSLLAVQAVILSLLWLWSPRQLTKSLEALS